MKSRIVALCASIVSILSCHAYHLVSPVISAIGDQYISAANLTKPIEEQKPLNLDAKDSLFQDWKRTPLSDFDRYHITFQLIANHYNTVSIKPIIDAHFIKKMELFYGGQQKDNALFDRFNSTQSAFGAAMLASMLAFPTDDISDLLKRQQIVRTLANDRPSRKILKTAFKTIAENEDQLLLLWQPVDERANAQLSMQYSWFFSFLNKNSAYLEFMKRVQTLTVGSVATLFGVCALVSPAFGALEFGWPGAIGGTLYGALSGAMSGLFIYAEAVNNRIACDIQQQMIAINSYIKQIATIDAALQKNHALKENLGSIATTLHNFLMQAEKPTSELTRLLSMLNTKTFEGTASFFSWHGTVLVAYKIIHEVKDQLIPALIAAGQVEAYLSIATLYNEFSGNNNATYTFVEFVTNNTTPYIKAKGFWNPFVKPNNVVTNSITLSHDATNNAIITGPNTGGKTTILKALLVDLLLAQTFGIAPAQKFICTPFAKINCYVNITDDIATGVSLFKAEVLRAKELLNAIVALPENSFSFTIIDEVFSGTSPKEGEHAAYEFAKKLSTYNKSIIVVATHFAKLTELPQATEGKFNNYHVEVLKNDDGSLNRTFLLKDGPSFLNVAMDLLQEEGIF